MDLRANINIEVVDNGFLLEITNIRRGNDYGYSAKKQVFKSIDELIASLKNFLDWGNDFK